MIIALGVLLLLAGLLVQGSVLSSFPVLGVRADLVLLIVLAWSVLRGFPSALAMAWGGGVLLDLVSGTPFGAHTLALGLVAPAAVLTTRHLLTDSLLPALGVALAGTLAYDLVLLLALQANQVPVAWGPAFWSLALPSAIVNALAMPLVYLPLLRAAGRGSAMSPA